MGALLGENGGGGAAVFGAMKDVYRKPLKMGLTTGALLGKLEGGSFTRGSERQMEGSFTGEPEGYAKQGSGNGCLFPQGSQYGERGGGGMSATVQWAVGYYWTAISRSHRLLY